MGNRASYLGPPAQLRLNNACRPLHLASGHYPYLVGSALLRQDYRDVDVRLMLDDDEIERMWPDVATDGKTAAQRHVINCAISDWLSAATGLPVDFQFQSVTEGNKYDGYRHALGMPIEYRGLRPARVNLSQACAIAEVKPGTIRQWVARSRW